MPSYAMAVPIESTKLTYHMADEMIVTNKINTGQTKRSNVIR